MMEYRLSLVAFGLTCIFLGSCKEKPQTDDIITRKVTVKEAPKGTQKMSDYTWDKTLEWMGGHYTLSIRRFSDTSLPKAKDEQGHEYYDNRISLKITRADGTTFFERTFSKGDFSDFTNNAYGRSGAMLGLAFDRIEGSQLVFGASIGSPDTMSDEYIPLVVVVSSTGSVSIKNDTQLDTGNGAPRDELEAAEAEGM